MNTRPVCIVGGGVIGLALGWELARAGKRVLLLERDRVGRAASWVSAGMLAPDAEIQFEEPELYQFSKESLRRWPDYAQALEAASGVSVDLRTEGALMVAPDRDSAEAYRRIYRFAKEQGLNVEWLTGDEALELEPFLAPRLAGAMHAPETYQVDNRRLIEALRVALEKAGGEIREQVAVVAVEPDEVRPAVRTAEGERIEAEMVVIAAGAWSGQIEGLGWKPPMRPIKGQVILLTMEPPFGLRYVVRGPDAYLVPKSDGRLIVGATMEEMGFDTRVTAGGLYKLLEGAWELVPGIYDLPVREVLAGLRPGTRDNRPILGYGAPGIVLATGHYRHGILLTPITAQEVARLILTGETSPWLAPFSPERFLTASTPS
ncbi:glycine oxidase ThiO [Rhodothermus marinus]|uniref:glycine oxidase ThiO n=1 Tax=Rhodothermus marinus TaxID=29549 RepID=UPI0006D0B56F|nr:glycine oxidase ThiO [Rhodothermus marinus]